ncbi:acyltransferase family protein [Flavitalea flava]
MDHSITTPIVSIPGTFVKSGSKAVTGRLLYIDNLRWVMIMLVVSMHAAVTYSHLGSWYYMENSPVGLPETGIFATYQVTLQSFFMGFLFFIAGYFVPGAYDKKGVGRFVRDRLFRLGLPLLFYMFILQPLAVFCISLFHGEVVYPKGFVIGYSHYITNGRWLGGTGPLWFCEALLIFCLGYALIRILGSRKKTEDTANREYRTGDHIRTSDPGLRETKTMQLPGKGQIWGFVALIAGLTFLIRFPWPNGTSFYNLQFCYFSQYVLFFIAGTYAFRGDWPGRFTAGTGKYWGRVALLGGLSGWVALLLLGGAFNGNLSAYKGGLHWQSLGMSCWESMTGVAISLFLLVWFREKFNEQDSTSRYFSANAFAVYVFHAPILITISRMISDVHGPLLLKFIFLTLTGILVSYALCSFLFRKTPLLKRIL